MDLSKPLVCLVSSKSTLSFLYPCSFVHLSISRMYTLSRKYYLNNYFDFHVCLSIWFRPIVRFHLSENLRQLLKSHHKMSIIKVAWWVSWVKNMHPGSPSSLRPKWDHCLQGEAEVCLLDFKTTQSEFQKASQTAAGRGKTELRLHNLKETSPPRVGPKQLCALAHLGRTRAVGTS